MLRILTRDELTDGNKDEVELLVTGEKRESEVDEGMEWERDDDREMVKAVLALPFERKEPPFERIFSDQENKK